MSCPWCIVVGCAYKQKKLDYTPESFNEPPESIVCMDCGNRTNAVYRRDDYYFTICFLKCCRINKGFPYLSCGTCHSSFGNHGTNVCEQCRTAYPGQFRNCPHCGKSESGK